jgi:hypothetical protein
MTRTPATLEQVAAAGTAQLIALHAWAESREGSRHVLPLDSGSLRIAPDQTAQITARPQVGAFRPDRLIIAADSADFLVLDILIGSRSQFAQAGRLPGAMFAANAIDAFVSFETVQSSMDVVLVVTYIGTNPEGVPFHAALVGRVAARQIQHAILWTDAGAFVLAEEAGRVDVCAVDGEDLDQLIDHLALSPVDPPRVVGIHLRDVEDRRVLFAVDDAAGDVIFEATVDASALHTTIDLDGYVPAWLTATDNHR